MSRLPWTARLGGAALLALAAAGLAAPWLAPYDPLAQDRERIYAAPELVAEGCVPAPGRSCRPHLLGTDALGRDVLSRLLFGARWSIAAAGIGVVATVLVGSLVGAVAGFYGGLWDRSLMRATELVMALPALYAVLAVRHAFAESMRPLSAALIVLASLSAVGWCTVARLVRTRVQSLREQDFVRAALAAGGSRWWALRRHVLPNALPFVLLQLGLALPFFFLGEATLSFLGLGIPEPEPSWGNMLAGAPASGALMATYWWTWAAPAGALTTAVLGANLWLEGLRRRYASPGSVVSGAGAG